MVAGLFAAAATWRLLYVARLAGSPLGGSLRGDAQLYWGWAEHLREVGPLGTNPFFLGPLYPYVLAGLGALGVESVNGVLIIQALWGAAAAALLADATRRLTRPGIGLLIGLLAAGYPSAVFFDGLVLSESLQFFLECLLLWWVIRHDRSTVDWRALAITGGLIGLCAESRASSALLLVPAAVLLRPGAWRSRGTVVCVGSMLAGFLVVAAPAAIRNHAVSREWIPFTYNFGLNLYVGNNPKASGSYVPVVDDRPADIGAVALRDGGGELDGRDQVLRVEHVALSPSGSSAYWAGKAWSHIRAHPAETLVLAVRKLGMLWNRREYPQIENIDGFRQVAGPLGWPWLGTFALLGPLALAGAWFTRGHRAPAAFPTGYLLVMSLGIVPFFVIDRYRHHLIPGAAVLAGIALERIRAAVSGHDWRGLRAAAAAVMGGLLVVYLPAPGMNARRYAVLLQSDLGERWLEHGRPDRAVAAFEQALRTLGAEGGAGAATLSAGEQADLFANHGRALMRLDRSAEARAWLERARDRAPARPSILRALAAAYAASGQRAWADSTYALLSRVDGGQAYVDLERGWAAARAADLEEAERCFDRAVQEQADLAAAWGALIRVQTQRGRIEQARTTLARARTAGLSRTTLRVYEALIAALEGDARSAHRALADVPASVLASDPTLADVVRVTREVLARRQ